MSSVIALLLATAVPDDNCTATLSTFPIDLIRGCQEVNGTCPATCGDVLQGLFDACEGKSYNTTEGVVKPFDSASEIERSALWVTQGSCRQALAEWVFSGSYNASCLEATSLMRTAAVLWCTTPPANASCSAECRAAMQGVFTTCSACDAVPSGDGFIMAKTYTLSIPTLLPQQCRNDIDTCAFGSSCSFDGVPATVESQVCPGGLADLACDDARSSYLYSVVLGLGAGCHATGGACPASCTSLFQSVLDSCAGKYYLSSLGAELFEPGLFFAGAAASRSVGAACQEDVLDLVLSSSSYNLTCPDAGAIFALWADAWCSSPSVPCSADCRNILEDVFSRCEPDSVLHLDNSSVSAVMLLQSINSTVNLSEECQADLDTCTLGQGCDFPARVDASTTAANGITTVTTTTEAGTLLSGASGTALGLASMLLLSCASSTAL